MSTPNAEDICEYCQDEGGIHNAIGEFMTCHECKETPKDEDLVIEFENQSGRKFEMFYVLGRWVIKKRTVFGWGVFRTFKNIKDAEECAKTLKRSV